MEKVQKVKVEVKFEFPANCFRQNLLTGVLSVIIVFEGEDQDCHSSFGKGFWLLLKESLDSTSSNPYLIPFFFLLI